MPSVFRQRGEGSSGSSNEDDQDEECPALQQPPEKKPKKNGSGPAPEIRKKKQPKGYDTSAGKITIQITIFSRVSIYMRLPILQALI